MRHYETTYILRPNLGEEQFTEIINRTNAIVTDAGGVIISLDRWGIKRLAYEINKEVQGYYVYMNYASTGDVVKEIERIFRIDDRALRFLTIKLGDSMTAESIEAEKQRIAEKAAALEAARAAGEETDDLEHDSDDDTDDDTDDDSDDK
ncbi:30S ribosomal protein S6 [Desulfobulbus alkaliphilus]|uniref:30S ribosomal protein S6 n=1 Tax=Desulfobulbus alkaliphilus TaxID=869814 RepID=UPI0019644FC8|nr:30S ribosomal protein S6 [Desulfobulbus alkaliphilus]MBM9537169.1 30S ribosomal protein S6 [Desulfobulbus alkaliphilus]